MTYTKTDWVNNVTPVDEARMDHIEDGIFNADAAAAAAAAQAAAAVPVPVGIVAGEVAVWNGSAWVRSSTMRINNAGQTLPRITTGAIAAGPPASPADADIWIATNIDTTGVCWMFKYNAGTASVYKWELIGGSPISRAVLTEEQTPGGYAAGANWTDLATIGPSFVVPRGGDYRVNLEARVMNNSGPFPCNLNIALFIAGAGPQDPFGAHGTPSAIMFETLTVSLNPASSPGMGGVTAGTTFLMRYAATNAGGGNFFGNRSMQLMPVRIA